MYHSGALARILLCLLTAAGVVAGQSQNQINIVPSELGLAVGYRSNTPVTGVLAVTAREPSTQFTAAVRYLGGSGGWLSITPVSGATPANITVTADGSKLDPGSYSAQITVTTNTGVGRVANVFLTVGTTSSNTVLAASPSALTFVGTPGIQTVPAQTLTVTSPTGANVEFRALANSSGWLSVSPLPIRTPGTVLVEAFQGGLAAGRYSGTISLVPINGGTPTVVPVTLQAAGETANQPLLQLSQTAISITHQTGTAVPAAQSVTVASNFGGFEFNASTSTPWITLTSPFNPTPSKNLFEFLGGTFNIIVDPAGLSTGQHIGTVTVASAGHPTENLNVTLRVVEVPSLNAQPSSVVLNELAPSATVIVTSTGNAALTFNAAVSAGAEWLAVTPASGTTASGSQTLTFTANTAGLTVGAHLAAVTLTAQNGTTLTIPVRLTITSLPNAGSISVQPDMVTLSAIQGSINPSQIVTLITDADTQRPFTAAAVSEGGWLTVDPVAGTAPGRITVTASLDRLPQPGVYSGTVVVTSLGTQDELIIPVTLRYTADVITADPGALAFTQSERGVNPPPVTFRLTAPVSSTFRIADYPPWMRLSTLTGVTPTDVTAWVEVALLPPGSNTGTIRVVGPKGETNVHVTFTAAAPAEVTLTPAAVNLTYNAGSPEAPSQAVTIQTGNEKNNFSVVAEADGGGRWLLVTPSSSTTPGRFTVTIDPTQVSPGQRTGNIRITLPTGVSTLPVTLTVLPPAAILSSILHAATLAPSSVSPGQIVTITGTAMGPLTGVAPRPTSAGAYETRVAETQVLFDGVPAPILFIRNDQINAIAPYSLANRLSTKLQIQQGERWSLPLELRVAEAAPGIFTVGGTGRGQAAAINEDLSMNSAASPAPRGSVITIYGTGEGQTDPQGQDGRVIATDLRRPLLPVVARIGGIEAEVLYAGSAAQAVAGLFQANIRVPEGVPTGTQPIEIQVGTARSQSGVTITVR